MPMLTGIRAVVIVCSLAISCPGQSAPAADQLNLAAGRQLIKQLTLNPEADRRVFESTGMELASRLLVAVLNRGADAAATRSEWTEMHQAIGGLIELDVIKGNLFKAAMMASLQAIYYRVHEEDYAAALAASRQALDLQQRSGQLQTLYICWENIGDDLIRLGHIDDGLAALREAHQSVENPLSSQAAVIWRKIIDAEIARGNLPTARREAEAFAERSAEAGVGQFRGRAMLARADVEIREMRWNEALDSVRRAQEAVTDEKERVAFGFESANEVLSVGLSALRALPFAEAMALAGRIDREFPDLPFTVSPFARQVMQFRRRLAGDFDALLHEDTAALENARTSGNVRGQIEALTRLAGTYRDANSVRQQIALLNQAIALEESLAPVGGAPAEAAAHRNYVQLLVVLGNAYAFLREPEHADQYFDQALRAVDSKPEARARSSLADLYGQAQLGKATVAELQNKPNEAREILTRALRQPVNSPAKFARGDVLLQLAHLEQTLHAHPLETVQYLQDAIDEYRLANDRRTEISVRLQLARYLNAEAWKQVPDGQKIAADNLDVADVASASMELADAQWRVCLIRGIAAENAGNPDLATRFYKDAVAKLDRLRAGLPEREQRQAFMDHAAIAEVYERLVSVLTLQGHQDEAWEYLERGKARSFLEGMQGRRFRGSEATARTQELDRLETEILRVRVQLSPVSLEVLRGSGQQPAAIRAELRTLEERFAAARQQAYLAALRPAQPLSLRPITLDETRKALPPHTALIEYAVLNGAVAAFIVTNASATQARWPTDTTMLTERIRRLRELLSDPESGEQLEPVLKEVSARLIDPVTKALPADIRTLLIVPSQALNYLPFQALLLPDGTALVSRYTISYLPSASTLQFLRPHRRRYTGDLFLGALGNISVDGMARLPGTLSETSSIQKLFRRSQRFVEHDFTHVRAVQALLDHEQVHFATHGLLDEDAPLFSALLTGPAEAGEDSRLSLYQVMDLKLKARLVVLSACETNLGPLLRGDEITGLTRTFLLAGAETVVSSLWKVSDEATDLLMSGFYRGLRAGSSASEALRQAEMMVRKEFPHPFFWAPFVSTGVE